MSDRLRNRWLPYLVFLAPVLAAAVLYRVAPEALNRLLSALAPGGDRHVLLGLAGLALFSLSLFAYLWARHRPRDLPLCLAASALIHVLLLLTLTRWPIAKPAVLAEPSDRRNRLATGLPTLTESLVGQEVRAQLLDMTVEDARPLTQERVEPMKDTATLAPHVRAELHVDKADTTPARATLTTPEADAHPQEPAETLAKPAPREPDALDAKIARMQAADSDMPEPEAVEPPRDTRTLALTPVATASPEPTPPTPPLPEPAPTADPKPAGKTELDLPDADTSAPALAEPTPDPPAPPVPATPLDVKVEVVPDTLPEPPLPTHVTPSAIDVARRAREPVRDVALETLEPAAASPAEPRAAGRLVEAATAPAPRQTAAAPETSTRVPQPQRNNRPVDVAQPTAPGIADRTAPAEAPAPSPQPRALEPKRIDRVVAPPDATPLPAAAMSDTQPAERPAAPAAPRFVSPTPPRGPGVTEQLAAADTSARVSPVENLTVAMQPLAAAEGPTPDGAPDGTGNVMTEASGAAARDLVAPRATGAARTQSAPALTLPGATPSPQSSTAIGRRAPGAARIANSSASRNLAPSLEPSGSADNTGRIRGTARDGHTVAAPFAAGTARAAVPTEVAGRTGDATARESLAVTRAERGGHDEAPLLPPQASPSAPAGGTSARAPARLDVEFDEDSAASGRFRPDVTARASAGAQRSADGVRHDLLSVGTAPEPASVPEKAVYQMRKPEKRRAFIRELGGTPESENAVERGLQWLAAAQSADGRWDVRDFATLAACGGSGDLETEDAAVTGLVLLSFLGAGYTHTDGIHRETIRKGLEWLLAGQTPDGDLRGGGTMYGQAIATTALCESYSLTGDDRLLDPARRAVDFIQRAQNPENGWRYRPRDDNDTSVTGWQILALKSARIAGMDVPEQHFRWTGMWLDRVRKGREGGLYAYKPGHAVTPVMTAEGWFCQLFMVAGTRARGESESVAYLMQHLPAWRPADRSVHLYYWYYATLAMYLSGTSEFDAWNQALRDALLAGQVADGPAAGSWDPVGQLGPRGGRIYTTATATLCLEVYYRFLPLYKLGDTP